MTATDKKKAHQLSFEERLEHLEGSGCPGGLGRYPNNGWMIKMTKETHLDDLGVPPWKSSYTLVKMHFVY